MAGLDLMTLWLASLKSGHSLVSGYITDIEFHFHCVPYSVEVTMKVWTPMLVALPQNEVCVYLKYIAQSYKMHSNINLVWYIHLVLHCG